MQMCTWWYLAPINYTIILENEIFIYDNDDEIYYYSQNYCPQEINYEFLQNSDADILNN